MYSSLPVKDENAGNFQIWLILQALAQRQFRLLGFYGKQNGSSTKVIIVNKIVAPTFANILKLTSEQCQYICSRLCRQQCICSFRSCDLKPISRAPPPYTLVLPKLTHSYYTHHTSFFLVQLMLREINHQYMFDAFDIQCCQFRIVGKNNDFHIVYEKDYTFQAS